MGDDVDRGDPFGKGADYECDWSGVQVTLRSQPTPLPFSTQEVRVEIGYEGTYRFSTAQ